MHVHEGKCVPSRWIGSSETECGEARGFRKYVGEGVKYGIGMASIIVARFHHLGLHRNKEISMHHDIEISKIRLAMRGW